LGDELSRIGSSPLALVDRAVTHRIRAAVDGAVDIIEVDAICTWNAVEQARAVIRKKSATVVAAIGGGKVIDTVRAACHYEDVPFASVPTIVASDAPTSSLAVVYSEDGSVDRDFFVRSNPALVLVDSQLIVEAPVRFFVAGIGDALSTWFEASSCQRSGKGNILGRQGTSLAYVIARHCFDTILQHGAAAVSHCMAGLVTPQVEEVIEANVLLSGLGFESGGVAAAHAIHHGLTTIHGTHRFLHGEKVAIGVQASLFLKSCPPSEIDQVYSFCASVGLPLRLSDIGVDAGNGVELQHCAERACKPGEIMHNEPFVVTPAMVVTALRAADAWGANYVRRSSVAAAKGGG
jgi:glycerol dehydrogenase